MIGYFCPVMQHKGPAVDIINELLEDCLLAYPVSRLLISFYQQYQRRGFLTKKQLQGLYAKASKVPSMHKGRLATLEAIIKKMPDRFKSELPASAPLHEKDETTETLIASILERYPQHKRVLYLKSKMDNHEPLSSAELSDLKRFEKLLK
jgi:hypothetical protein